MITMETPMPKSPVDGPKPKGRGSRGIPRYYSHAYQFRVVYDDGVVRDFVRVSQRKSPEYLLRDMKEHNPSIRTAELVRSLSQTEYESHPLRGKPVITDPEGPAPDPAGPETPVLADRPAVPPDRPHAWEVLYRRHGKTSTRIVVCPTEAGAVQLLADLDGVEAATSIRPLTLAEYRRAMK